MTKKYEKFEGWMVGKKVEYSYINPTRGTRTGVISSDRNAMEYNEVKIDWDNGESRAWTELSRVKFLEEEFTISWEVGQVVWDVVYGKGVVVEIAEYSTYPVVAQFSDETMAYTEDGKTFETHGRTLFFSEPTIIADTMPPVKPFVPKLKFDDRLMVINSHGKVGYYGYVEQEFEDSVAMRTGEVYEKVYYNFFKLGEEIKWEN